MAYAFIIGIVVFMASFLSILTKRKFEQVVALAFFIIIVLMYILGLCGHLKLGIYLIVVLSVLGGAFTFYSVIKNKSIIFSQIVTPGFLAFCIFAVVIFWGTLGRLLTSWDEFSHWGLVVKNMFELDAFGNAPDSTTCFKGYPPATALLQYFFEKIHTVFSEAYLFRATDLLAISLLLPVFKMFSWKDWKRILSLLLLIFILPIIFYPDFYTTIYVDGMLGLLFANMMFTYFADDKLSRFTLLYLGITGCILSLTKSSGTGLAIIALLIILVDMIFFKRTDIHNIIHSAKKRWSELLNWCWLICPLAFLAFGKLSWDFYLKATNTNEAWGTSKITWAGIRTLFTADNPEYRVKTIQTFFSNLFAFNDNAVAIKMSFLTWIVFLAAFIYLMQYMSHNRIEKKSICIFGTGIIAGFILYTISLLILYLFTYSEYEAKNTASMSRYLYTYLLGALAFVVLMTISKVEQSQIKFSNKAVSLFLCFFLLFTPATKIVDFTILAKLNVQSTLKTRASYTTSLKFNQILSLKDGKVYFISQNTTGFDYWVTRYQITPVKMSDGFSWSLGKPYSDKDLWTQDISVQQWAETLKKDYTHVYLFKIDDQFKELYGSLFENVDSIKNDTLYVIDKTRTTIVIKPIT